MSTRALVVVAALAVAGCARVSNVADTTVACTAALDLGDRLANAEDEDPAVDDFVSAARESGNEELIAIADRAQRAEAADDPEGVEAAIEEAKRVCEEEGSL